MRVTSMIPTTQYNMQQSTQVLATAEQEVSTGLRVQHLSDDPSASANMVRSLMESSQNDQFSRNVSSLQSRMETADGALSQVVTALNSAITAGTSGASDALAASNRQAIAEQVQGILQTVVAQGNTSFEGSYLFGGTASGAAPFVAASTGYVSGQGSVSSPLTASTPLTSGSETSISDAATGQTFTFHASSGDTMATLQQAVAGAVSAGTLSSGTAVSFNPAGELTIGQPSNGGGVVASSDDAALGALTAVSGTQVSNAYAYVGSNAVNTVSVGGSLQVQSNVAGSTLLGSGTKVLQSLGALVNALQSGTPAEIAAATQTVSTAVSSFNTARVPLDEGLSQLSAQDSYLSQESVTLSTQQTSLTGISLAVAATNLSQAELTNNAVLAAAAKALPQTLLQYLTP